MSTLCFGEYTCYPEFVRAKSGLGKACSYALKQWERLECYAGAGHGMVEKKHRRR
jgi:hypothetical protein